MIGTGQDFSLFLNQKLIGQGQKKEDKTSKYKKWTTSESPLTSTASTIDSEPWRQIQTPNSASLHPTPSFSDVAFQKTSWEIISSIPASTSYWAKIKDRDEKVAVSDWGVEHVSEESEDGGEIFEREQSEIDAEEWVDDDGYGQPERMEREGRGIGGDQNDQLDSDEAQEASLYFWQQPIFFHWIKKKSNQDWKMNRMTNGNAKDTKMSKDFKPKSESVNLAVSNLSND